VEIGGDLSVSGSLSIRSGWKVPQMLSGIAGNGVTVSGAVPFSKSFTTPPSVVCQLIFNQTSPRTLFIVDVTNSGFTYDKFADDSGLGTSIPFFRF
jgi:hypothetical protein